MAKVTVRRRSHATLVAHHPQLFPIGQRRPNVCAPTSKTNVFTHFPVDLNCEICKMTKTARARCETKPQKDVDSLLPPKAVGELITADRKNIESTKRIQSSTSKRSHLSESILVLDPKCPEKSVICTDTVKCLQRFMLPTVMLERCAQTTRWRQESCAAPAWTLDAATHHRC